MGHVAAPFPAVRVSHRNEGEARPSALCNGDKESQGEVGPK
jgi:hypothetical protein